MITDRIKAWIALAGSIVTALLGLDIIPTGSWRTGLTIASAVITSVLTYMTGNAGYARVIQSQSAVHRKGEPMV